jgi:hypothetical protein
MNRTTRAAMKRRTEREATRHGCTIERIAQGCAEDPNIEVLAPENHWFPDAGTHTLLCHGWDDAYTRVTTEGRVARCTQDCCATADHWPPAN